MHRSHRIVIHRLFRFASAPELPRSHSLFPHRMGGNRILHVLPVIISYFRGYSTLIGMNLSQFLLIPCNLVGIRDGSVLVHLQVSAL